MKKNKLLIINVAALGYDLWEQYHKSDFWEKQSNLSISSIFPALTSPVQASLRTNSLPASHGVVSNGFFFKDLKKVMFWEQSSNLICGDRIWDAYQAQGGTVGQICWQQSIGENCELVLSPAPIHKHHGGMIQDFYSQPPNLYKKICCELRSKFNLFNYWGPFTSLKSSKWICDATMSLLNNKTAPDILFTYIPHLDYDLQRFGTDSPKIQKVFQETENLIEALCNSAKNANYEVILFGDYAINNAHSVIYPNKILRDSNDFSIRNVKKMYYPDLYSSKGFAMVDHQIAHVYINDKKDINRIKSIFEKTQGISRVLEHKEIKNERSGDLILEADTGYWFAYQWWNKKVNAPDYATHIDIHNKIGFDPAELFMSIFPPMSTSQDNSKIKGTHGRASDRKDNVLWSSSISDLTEVNSILEGSGSIKSFLNSI